MIRKKMRLINYNSSDIILNNELLKFLFKNLSKMFWHNAIQVGTMTAIMMICYDARYLLLNIDGGIGGETNTMVEHWQNRQGNICLNLYSKI